MAVEGPLLLATPGAPSTMAKPTPTAKAPATLFSDANEGSRGRWATVVKPMVLIGPDQSATGPVGNVGGPWSCHTKFGGPGYTKPPGLRRIWLCCRANV